MNAFHIAQDNQLLQSGVIPYIPGFAGILVPPFFRRNSEKGNIQ